MTDQTGAQSKQGLVGQDRAFLADLELPELVQPRQGAFDDPAVFSQPAPVATPAFGEHGGDALFLRALLCGCES